MLSVVAVRDCGMDDCDAMLVLSNGMCFSGKSVGAKGVAYGELCFTTAMTGYQETVTDPSFAGQVVLFTAPHIGNTGVNHADSECPKPLLRGVVMREMTDEPSNYRARCSFKDFLSMHNIVGIVSVDTRALTVYLRDYGLCQCAIVTFDCIERFDLGAVTDSLKTLRPEHNFMSEVVFPAHSIKSHGEYRVVLVNYGAKSAIADLLEAVNCVVVTVPYNISFEDILELQPDGIVLSNGPGDPVDVYDECAREIDKIVRSGVPVFGICLGHQIAGLSLGCKTVKMKHGHRGINHPVKCIDDGSVTVTTQNHGFMIADCLPEGVSVTHVSLLDGTISGIKSDNFPVFSVQYHPEASSGPHDNYGLFDKFIDMMNVKKMFGVRCEF